jgi:hypothetical protein
MHICSSLNARDQVPCPYKTTGKIMALHILTNARDQVSCPYKTTGKIMALNILTFTYLDNEEEGKKIWIEW